MLKEIDVNKIENDIFNNKIKILNDADELNEDPCICLTYNQNYEQGIQINSDGICYATESWALLSGHVFYIIFNDTDLSENQINSASIISAIIVDILDIPIDDEHIFFIDNSNQDYDNIIIDKINEYLENGY